MREQAFFLYGTLRIGQGNYSWTTPAVVHEFADATASGDLYFVHGRGGYPVADAEGEGTIRGDVVMYDMDHRLAQRMYDMEVGSGYEPREVVVTLADGSAMTVTIWHYLHLDRAGEKIEDGDWVAATRGVRW